MIESGYWLMVTLWGEMPNAIRIDFNSNKSLHRLQDAQAQRLEIFNALVLWVTGVIDQAGFCQILGYQDPTTPLVDPPTSPLLGPFPSVGIGAKEPGDAGTEQTQPQRTESIHETLDAIVEMLSNFPVGQPS
jgi:hypothetical protein